MGKNVEIMKKDLTFEEFEDYARNVPRREYESFIALSEAEETNG